MSRAKNFDKEELAIQAAKDRLVELYGYGADKRPWHEASPPDSYGNKEYRVTVYVLQGSPPKGMILFNRSYGIVRGFDCRARLVFTFTIGPSRGGMA